MKKSRLEAFSDGVIAIIITIMVLELRVPHAPTLAALAHLWPTLLSYLLSSVVSQRYSNRFIWLRDSITSRSTAQCASS